MNARDLIEGMDRCVPSNEQIDFENSLAEYLRARGWHCADGDDELRELALTHTNLQEKE